MHHDTATAPERIGVTVNSTKLSKQSKIYSTLFLNLDIAIDYFIFYNCLLSKGGIRLCILYVDASSVAVPGCRSRVCVHHLEQDK